MGSPTTTLISSTVHAVSLAVVRLEFFCGEVPIGLGTGYFDEVDGKRYLFTNWHNVTGREPDTGREKARDGITPDAVVVHGHRVLQDGVGVKIDYSNPLLYSIAIEFGSGSVWRMHPNGQAVDIAAVPIDLWDGPPETLKLNISVGGLTGGGDVYIEVGDDLVIVGYPKGLTPTGTLPLWKSGMVATEPVISIGGEPCFLIDSATRKGMSGSPVFKKPAQLPGAAQTRSKHRSQAATLSRGNGLQFAGIYSGRLGETDMLEAQLGKVWRPDAIYAVVREGRALDWRLIR